MPIECETRMTRIFAQIRPALLLLCLLHATPANAASYALTNANLFDGVNERVERDATIFVKDGKIERIAEAVRCADVIGL